VIAQDHHAFGLPMLAETRPALIPLPQLTAQVNANGAQHVLLQLVLISPQKLLVIMLPLL
jgi:hypothetical protein